MMEVEEELKEPEQYFILKALVLGEAHAGKTCLVDRLGYNRFHEHPTTIGMEFIIKKGFYEPKVLRQSAVAFMLCWGQARRDQEGPLSLISKDVAKLIMWKIQYLDRGNPASALKYYKAQVWDTCSRERFGPFSFSYFRYAYGVFLCFDISKRESFSRLHIWAENAAAHCQDLVFVAVVGCKKDLEDRREVSVAEAVEWTKGLGLGVVEAKYFETSSKTGEGTENLFEEMVAKIFENRNEAHLRIGPIVAPPANTGGCVSYLERVKCHSTIGIMGGCVIS